jgi:endonuclease YncB( thermonuclease family)
MLGALLGLVLGLAAAALLETLRPRLHGGDTLARELQTPHLGAIPANAGDEAAHWSPEPIALVLRLAAQGAGVRHVSLLAAEPFPTLGIVAKRIEDASNRPHTVEAPEPVPAGSHPAGFEGLGQRPATGAPAVRVRLFGIDAPSMNNGAGTGVAVVAPESLTRSQLVELTHLLSVMPTPVLGLITYRSQRRALTWLRLHGRSGLGEAWSSPAHSS